jgi:hypothetical protein
LTPRGDRCWRRKVLNVRLATLVVIDVSGPNKTHLREYSSVADDDPLYDSVAPDEDYVTLPTIQENSPKEKTSMGKVGTDKPPEIVVEQLTKQLQQSDSTILDLKAEVNQLKAHLETLKYENIELKTRLSQHKVPDNNNSINGDGDSNSLQTITVGGSGRDAISF